MSSTHATYPDWDQRLSFSTVTDSMVLANDPPALDASLFTRTPLPPYYETQAEGVNGSLRRQAARSNLYPALSNYNTWTPPGIPLDMFQYRQEDQGSELNGFPLLMCTIALIQVNRIAWITRAWIALVSLQWHLTTAHSNVTDRLVVYRRFRRSAIFRVASNSFRKNPFYGTSAFSRLPAAV